MIFYPLLHTNLREFMNGLAKIGGTNWVLRQP